MISSLYKDSKWHACYYEVSIMICANINIMIYVGTMTCAKLFKHSSHDMCHHYDMCPWLHTYRRNVCYEMCTARDMCGHILYPWNVARHLTLLFTEHGWHTLTLENVAQYANIYNATPANNNGNDMSRAYGTRQPSPQCPAYHYENARHTS